MQKELYFTDENRNEKVSQWITESKQMKKYVAFEFDLSKSVLLVLDMQNFFLDKTNHAYIPSADTIIENISKLIGFFHQSKRPVIFTQHIDTQQPEEMMTRWWRDSVEEGTKDAEISSSLDTKNAIIVRKTRYSAFESTNLQEILLNKEVNQILITGIMSHLCCETTARDAFMKDFEVVFIVDANATYTEELHLGTIRAISHGFGRCISTEEIINE